MKIQIVNENDEIIALKERSLVNRDRDIWRVAALWVVNSKDEVLIAKRHMNKESSPGKWGPSVAGTVEEGETYESNIYKEAEEEIGLKGFTFEKVINLFMKEPRRYFVQWYKVQVDKDISDFTIQEDEVEKLEWKSRSELIDLIKQSPDDYIPNILASLSVLMEGVRV